MSRSTTVQAGRSRAARSTRPTPASSDTSQAGPAADFILSGQNLVAGVTNIEQERPDFSLGGASFVENFHKFISAYLLETLETLESLELD